MSYPNYGNIKMRGKKEKLLRCTCCVAENRKYQEYLKQAAKEIKEELDRELICQTAEKYSKNS
jgi:hypothetical protein